MYVSLLIFSVISSKSQYIYKVCSSTTTTTLEQIVLSSHVTTVSHRSFFWPLPFAQRHEVKYDIGKNLIAIIRAVNVKKYQTIGDTDWSLYFWWDNFENDKFESDKFTLWKDLSLVH